VRVYSVATGQRGYRPGAASAVTEQPSAVVSDPVLARLVGGSEASPALGQATGPLKVVTWSAFGAIWLLTTWRATSRRQFWGWSLILLLAWYWLLSAGFWPWYVIWSLALAALAPTSQAARLTMLLSATVLFLYVSNGYRGSDHTWIYTYRSVPALALPLLIFGLLLSGDLTLGRRSGGESNGPESDETGAGQRHRHPPEAAGSTSPRAL
jgi:hypothetical protein